MEDERRSIALAVQDFRYARRRAAVGAILAKLTGKSSRLLSFEEVKGKLIASGQLPRGLQDVPLDAIVGSVGRYDDFDRKFFPRDDSIGGRWARVKAATERAAGLSPVDLYKVGDAYFVLDGHHRVSVARQQGSSHIQAYVTEVKTKVPLSPDDQPDDLIIKAGYADFLSDTHLDVLRPDVDFLVTIPGRFRQLREHIAAHQYFRALEKGEEIPYQQAVLDWVDNHYLPTVQLIRDEGLLRDFPGRTETDLYLFLMEHKGTLSESLGWEMRPDEATGDLAERASPKPTRIFKRFLRKITAWLQPSELDAGPPPGYWRTRYLEPRRRDVLFSTILVPLSGSPKSWKALEQAFVMAEREKGVLRGLHVVPREPELRIERALAVQSEFSRRCHERGIEGKLVIAEGDIADTISERARWNDLVVVHLDYPPPDQPLARLRSGIRTIIHASPRPVLAVPEVTELRKALLAYDGSPKSEEALFLSAYLACCWRTEVAVVIASEDRRDVRGVEKRARDYLAERNVEAKFEVGAGEASDLILSVARERGCDLIVMGGYSSKPMVEAVIGSVVDHVLREFKAPVLICR